MNKKGGKLVKIKEKERKKNFQYGERALVRALKSGEEWAYEYLYERYAPQIGSIARSYLGQDDVEDVIQEVMIRIYKGIKNFRGESKLSTWIHSIAVNVCKDMVSKKSRNLEIKTSFSEGGDDEEDMDMSHLAHTEENVMKKAISSVVYEHIMKALDKLSPEDRLLIKLRDVDGLSYEEIARIMNKPVGTVKSRLHYAREKLRRILEGGGKDVERGSE